MRKVLRRVIQRLRCSIASLLLLPLHSRPFLRAFLSLWNLFIFHLLDTSKVDTIRKRKPTSRKTASKVVKIAPSEDFPIPLSPMQTRTPSERKLGHKSPKVPVPTLTIDVQSEDTNLVSQKVRKAEINYVIEIASLVNILRMVSMCMKCQQSALDIFEDASTNVTSTSCLLIRCGVCMNSQTLWSVSGQFGQSKDTLSAGEGARAKWNQMEIAVVLVSRMIGIGYEMYHAILDIPAPPSKLKFENIHMDMVSVQGEPKVLQQKLKIRKILIYLQ